MGADGAPGCLQGSPRPAWSVLSSLPRSKEACWWRWIYERLHPETIEANRARKAYQEKIDSVVSMLDCVPGPVAAAL
jgi:hypothetical protein